MYKENIKYQFARALNILSALDSAAAHQGQLDAFNIRNGIDDGTIAPDSEEAKKVIPWVNVDKIGQAPTDSDGNPYCYLMEDYVRLATPEESEDLLYALRKHDGSKNEIYITSKSGLHVSMDDFVKRMHGRTLNQELELAGIRNLGDIKGSPYSFTTKDYWTHVRAPYGIAFKFERWGKADEAYKTMSQTPPLATLREESFSSTVMEVKEFKFWREKDFAYVCPAFLRWPDSRANMVNIPGFFYKNIDQTGNTYVPDGAVHKRYSYNDQQWYYEMPMSYFVKLSR
jgi:hypothetical protein